MLVLEPYGREHHFDALTSWFGSESDLVQWGGPAMEFPLTPQQVEEGDVPTRSLQVRNWVALLHAELIGHAQLIADFRSGNAVVSKVAVAPRRRRQGWAGAMLRPLLSAAFAANVVQRVELHVFTWNTPALRSYERLGFKLEGVRRSSAQVGDQRWDTAFMGLLRSEWAGPQVG